jgi:hypothetical protein
MSLQVYGNNIGAKGARSLAAALDKNSTLTSMDLYENNIFAECARSLSVALRTNRALEGPNPSQNLVADLLRVNKLALKVASWVASAVVRLNKLLDDALVLPPALAACWRSATSFWISSCRTQRPVAHSLAGATSRLPTFCLARRPRCGRSCGGWPTPSRKRLAAGGSRTI